MIRSLFGGYTWKEYCIYRVTIMSNYIYYHHSDSFEQVIHIYH